MVDRIRDAKLTAEYLQESEVPAKVFEEFLSKNENQKFLSQL